MIVEDKMETLAKDILKLIEINKIESFATDIIKIVEIKQKQQK